MRLLLLSDIHANRFGLEAVLEAAKCQYDQILCLGDVVGYGAHPNECCEILRDLKSWCLLGNHDSAAINRLSIADFNHIASEAIKWTRLQLNAANISWLESLESRLDRSEENFQAVHGSLHDPLEEYITGCYTARPILAQMSYPICFFGHTHIAVVFSNLDRPGKKYQLQENLLPFGGELSCEADWKYLVNPGSCGQPRDGNPQARYAIFDTISRDLKVFAIDYPWEEARTAIIAAGLPSKLGERLFIGK